MLPLQAPRAGYHDTSVHAKCDVRGIDLDATSTTVALDPDASVGY